MTNSDNLTEIRKCYCRLQCLNIWPSASVADKLANTSEMFIDNKFVYML